MGEKSVSGRKATTGEIFPCFMEKSLLNLILEWVPLDGPKQRGWGAVLCHRVGPEQHAAPALAGSAPLSRCSPGPPRMGHPGWSSCHGRGQQSCAGDPRPPCRGDVPRRTVPSRHRGGIMAWTPGKGIGIPGGQGSCKLPSPWVTWLSLGLHVTGKQEVCGQSHVGCPEKQRRQIPDLLMGAVSGRGVPGLQAVGFRLVPL